MGYWAGKALLLAGWFVVEDVAVDQVLRQYFRGFKDPRNPRNPLIDHCSIEKASPKSV